MTMRCVVTGSDGFIGTHLCRRLRELGHTVCGLDLKSGNDILVCDLPPADLVFHLAAQTDAVSSDVEADARVNIMGLLRVLAEYGSRLVFASSVAIHHPVSPYGISKLAGEHYVALYGASVVRFCNIYGPGGHGVIDRFAAADVLTIYGSGNQTRSYAHVDMAINLLAAELEERRPLRILYGNVLTVNQIADRYPEKRRRHVAARSREVVHAPQLG